MQLIQAWARQGLYGLPKAIGHCATPVCSDCQFGGARRKSHNTTSDTTSAPTLPGDFVATDQMMSPVGGLIPFCTGMRSMRSKRRYTCSTLFVDGATKYIHCCHQEAATGKETVQSKQNFEQFARAHDVHVHHYQCDNGIYQSKAFHQEVQDNNQSQSFTGIGAHWQNGLAERYIGVLTRKASIMLLHAMACWPGVITEEFWSYAYKLAAHQHNHLPSRKSPTTPFELFTMQDDTFRPTDYRVFRCPAYVLDPSLANGNPRGKWHNRCYVGVYVGVSIVHASNVAMIYNPATGLTTPAYHCLYDEDFTTVSNADPTAAQLENLDSIIQRLIQTHQWHHSDQYSDPDPSIRDHNHYADPAPPSGSTMKHVYPDAYTAFYSEAHALRTKAANLKREVHLKRKHLQSIRHRSRHKDPALYYEGATKPPDAKRRRTTSQLNDLVDSVDPKSTGAYLASVPALHDQVEHLASLNENSSSSPTNLSPHTALDILARMGYKLPPGTVLERTDSYSASDVALFSHIGSTLSALDRPSSPTGTIEEFMTSHCLDSIYFAAQECCPVDDSTNFDDWMACRAITPHNKNNNPGVLTQSQMLRAKDSAEFVRHQRNEIDSLQGAHVFAYKRQSTLLEGASILNSIWSY
jgi:hypothetical protein